MEGKIEITVIKRGVIVANIEGNPLAIYEGMFAILGDLIDRDLREGASFDDALQTAMEEIKRIRNSKVTSQLVDFKKGDKDAGNNPEQPPSS